jgi:hypothetical protein
MINFIKRLLGIKPKPISYVWLHIHSQANEGVIGWLATDRKETIKGMDYIK